MTFGMYFLEIYILGIWNILGYIPKRHITFLTSECHIPKRFNTSFLHHKDLSGYSFFKREFQPLRKFVKKLETISQSGASFPYSN